MKTFLYSLFAVVASFSSLAQKTYVTENQLGYDVLHWHYDRYNNAVNDEWYLIELNGKKCYEVSFTYEGYQYVACYDEKGNILKENKIADIKDIPSQINQVMDYRIVKYKYVQYAIESLFENKQVVAQTHRIDARSKTGGQILMWFDMEFNFIPQSEIMKLAGN